MGKFSLLTTTIVTTSKFRPVIKGATLCLGIVHFKPEADPLYRKNKGTALIRATDESINRQ